MSDIVKGRIPEHIAIIMDGNGRWAKSKNLTRAQGHIEGVRRVEEIVDYASEIGIKVLTLFTFSTENWDRPKQEVKSLMNTISAVLHHKAKKLQKQNMRFQTIGRKERLPENVLKSIDKVVDDTKMNDGIIINLAFNYGSRSEIIDAIQEIATSVQNGSLKPDEITQDTLSQALYTRDLPDPDLLIRTSGEQRISNFLLWQLSYSELYFTEKFWPDFTSEEFKKAIAEFQSRERRFGKVMLGNK